MIAGTGVEVEHGTGNGAGPGSFILERTALRARN